MSITLESTESIKRHTSLRRKRLLAKVITYAVLIILSIIVLIPFFWMVSTSLKTGSAMWKFPPQWIPSPFQWSNYAEAFQEVPLAHYFVNTLIIEIFVLIGQVVSCTLVGYGFSRFRFRGREVLFMVMLATMLIPSQVTMIPLFLLFSKLGWINTYLPLIVPAFFGNAFYVFLMRQFLQTIPLELDEAAKIDGANAFYVLWKILVPILRPSIMIIVVFTFTDVYNDFMGPLIYLNKPELYPVSLALKLFLDGESLNNWGGMFAMSSLSLVPVFIIFFLFQRYIVEGIATSGLKG
ncbi:MAG: carbohydrate ABC transporter permease [Alicyclobacillus sp.]|nr:carbohydrate ABC transporter permease [Alicyclobacillus sp.]